MMRSVLGGMMAAGMLISGAAWAQDAAPHGDRNAPSNAAVQPHNVRQTDAPASGANSFTESQARAHIAKGGYAHVSVLRKDRAGLWQGTARKDGKTVHVALDYKGDISAR